MGVEGHPSRDAAAPAPFGKGRWVLVSRKPLSKRMRFEVLKRDSFTCQYCARKAPEVVLHVDHIHPVAKGGRNSLLNLVTSCADCNSGKGAIPLSDASAIAKQRAQLDELQARREQIELMIQWHQELANQGSLEVDAVVAAVNKRLSVLKRSLTDTGIKDLRKATKRFGMSEMLLSIEIAFDHYADPGEAIGKIAGIATVRKRERANPGYSERVRLRNCVMKAFPYAKSWVADQLINFACERGASVDSLFTVLNAAHSWSAWQDMMELEPEAAAQ